MKIGYYLFTSTNKTEDPSVPYAGQGYIRALNVIEIIKSLENAKLN